MKKLFAATVLLALCMSLPASGFGYGIAFLGEKSTDGSEFPAIGISASFTRDLDRHIPDIYAEAMLSYVSPYFCGLNLRASLPVFSVRNHIFSFMFPDAVIWVPKASLGAEYRMSDAWSLYFSISPLSFYDTAFSYEFFSPYGLYDIRSRGWGWGLCLMRISVYFGG